MLTSFSMCPGVQAALEGLVAVSCEILLQECFFGSGKCFFGTEAEELMSFVKFAGVESTRTALCSFSAVYSEPAEIRSGRGE